MSSAVLALADGTVFRGRAIGASGTAVGECVFNTAMTGYQEILTDPSYAGQLVTLTYPHIGNVGANPLDAESSRVHAAALVIRDAALSMSNWRGREDLGSYLLDNQVVGIAEIDTRKLTRLLSSGGAQNACVIAGPDPDPDEAVARARAHPGLAGMDLAREVTTARSYDWTETVWDPASDAYGIMDGQASFNVVAYDFGVKRNILRLLAARGCAVTVVSATTPVEDVLARRPDGVFLSNGPGDPEPCAYAVATIAALMSAGVPLFGICLGHQLLALACGARTVKMKFGHHGANHPVTELATGRVFITSQNHGFAVDEASLPPELVPTHRSLFDGTLQGVRHRSAPAFGFQGHPEASPGPHDIRNLFDDFVELMRKHGQTA